MRNPEGKKGAGKVKGKAKCYLQLTNHWKKGRVDSTPRGGGTYLLKRGKRLRSAHRGEKEEWKN